MTLVVYQWKIVLFGTHIGRLIHTVMALPVLANDPNIGVLVPVLLQSSSFDEKRDWTHSIGRLIPAVSSRSTRESTPIFEMRTSLVISIDAGSRKNCREDAKGRLCCLVFRAQQLASILEGSDHPRKQ